MKLWHIAQWGNKKDGPNGHDTQCIVAAVDLKSAVEKAELHIGHMYSSIDLYRDGKADVAYLLGEDGRPDGEAQLVIRVWLDNAFNLGHYPAWYRHYWDTNEWADSESVYGSEPIS